MIDLRILRSDPERVRSSQRSRGEDAGLVDALLAADTRRRELETSYGEIRNTQKQLSARIGPLTGAVKRAGDDGRAAAQAELDEVMGQAQELAAQVKLADAARAEAEAEATRLAREPVQPRRRRPPRSAGRTTSRARARRHAAGLRGRGLRAARPRRARRSCSAPSTSNAGRRSPARRFYYLTGVGALLELALINLAMALATAARLHPGDPAVAGQAVRHGGHRLPRPGRRERLPARARRPVPRRHGRGAARRVPLRTRSSTPRRCRCRYVGLLAVLPARGRHLRQGHPRHLPGALVRQGRDVLLRRRRRTPRPSTSGCSDARRSSSTRSSCRTASSTWRRATSARRLPASSTSRRGSRPRVKLPGGHLHVELHRVPGPAPAGPDARRRGRHRAGRDAERHAGRRSPRAIVAIFENHQQPDGSVTVPQALRPYLGGLTAFCPR